MFNDIKKNKIKSGFIVSIFILVITLIIYYICMDFNLGPVSIVFALTFSIITAFCSYYYSDKIILSISKARPATKEENLKLVNILDSLVISSGMQDTPKLYVIQDPRTKCFCYWKKSKKFSNLYNYWFIRQIRIL